MFVPVPCADPRSPGVARARRLRTSKGRAVSLVQAAATGTGVVLEDSPERRDPGLSAAARDAVVTALTREAAAADGVPATVVAPRSRLDEPDPLIPTAVGDDRSGKEARLRLCLKLRQRQAFGIQYLSQGIKGSSDPLRVWAEPSLAFLDRSRSTIVGITPGERLLSGETLDKITGRPGEPMTEPQCDDALRAVAWRLSRIRRRLILCAAWERRHALSRKKEPGNFCKQDSGAARLRRSIRARSFCFFFFGKRRLLLFRPTSTWRQVHDTFWTGDGTPPSLRGSGR